jgi:hypothetical protein
MVMGAITSYASSSLSGMISPYVSSWGSGLGGQAVQQSLTQGITGSATGFALSAGFAWANGASFKEGLSQGGQGALMGLGIGFSSGLITGMRSAYKDGENPWTGKSTATKAPVYDFTLDPSGDNVTLYRGTTGTENNSKFPLYMTDDANYAQSYVANGGKVVEVTIPRSATFDMKQHNVLEVSSKPQYHINGTSGIEYKFSPSVKSSIIIRLK